MENILILVVAVVAIIYLIVRRFIGTPLVAKDVFLSPLLFLAIGLWSLRDVDHWTRIDAVLLLAGLGLGLLWGAVRGTTTLIHTRDGVLYQRYRTWTLLVWVLSLASSLGIYLLEQQLGASEHAHSTMLSIGVGLLGEMLTCGVRALSTGMPFSPPKDGRELGRLNDALDRLKAPAPADDVIESPSLRQAVAILLTHHRGE